MGLRRILAPGSIVLLFGLMVFWIALERPEARVAGTYTAPGVGPISQSEALNEFFQVIPALLMVVYDAFGRTDEGEIYDTLAIVSDGAALETLYLERAGAMVGGGLTQGDQTIHEMRLKSARARPSGEGFVVDATWEVIGTVGHSEHMHVRGNTYRANLTIAPVDGAWKMIAFQLLGVDRNTAGEIIEVDPS